MWGKSARNWMQRGFALHDLRGGKDRDVGLMSGAGGDGVYGVGLDGGLVVCRLTRMNS
jgi:hypothetical protein